MGNEGCTARPRLQEGWQSWDDRPRTDRSQTRTVTDALLQRLAQTSPAIRHPAIFRYDLVEVLRFLRTARYDAESAATAVLSALRWRIKNPISKPALAAALKTKRLFFFEADFSGVPILVVREPSEVTVEGCCLVLRHFFDFVQPKTGCARDGVTLLVDCGGGPLPDALLLGALSFCCEHYPERLHRVIVIRADLTTLSAETRARLRPHRRSLLICTEDYRATLLRFIPPERLLFEYGGLRKFRPDGVSVGRLPTRAAEYVSSYQQAYSD